MDLINSVMEYFSMHCLFDDNKNGMFIIYCRLIKRVQACYKCKRELYDKILNWYR